MRDHNNNNIEVEDKHRAQTLQTFFNQTLQIHRKYIILDSNFTCKDFFFQHIDNELNPYKINRLIFLITIANHPN